jgi:hypothetical protein
MKRLIIAIIFLTGCAQPNNQMDYLIKKFPHTVVEPATGLLQQHGYEFIMEDTVKKQIYAVSFYPFSETKISSIRNIR